MRFFRSVFSFLLYSNLFIAFCAIALVFQSSILSGISFSLEVYLFIFFATLLEYNVQRFLVLIRNLNVPMEPRYAWLYKHSKLFYVLFVITIIGLAYSFFFLQHEAYLWIGVSIVMTLLYNFPLIPTPSGLKRLRAIPHMKVITIGVVWTISTLCIPLAGSDVPVLNLFIAALIRFLFVIAITIPFDVRDVKSDQKRGLKTIPLVFGVRQAYSIAVSILVFSGILGIASHFLGDNYYGLSMLISGMITAVFIKQEGWRTHPYYYYGLLDGTLLLCTGVHFLLFEYFIQ